MVITKRIYVYIYKTRLLIDKSSKCIDSLVGIMFLNNNETVHYNVIEQVRLK